VVFDPNMDSEVRITVIATGFVTQYNKGIAGAEELRRLITGSSDILDTPSFLRRAQRFPASHLTSNAQSRRMVTPERVDIHQQ